jgi:hypothetical protein
MAPINILQVIDSLNVGGSERQCVEIAQRINSSTKIKAKELFNGFDEIHYQECFIPFVVLKK